MDKINRNKLDPITMYPVQKIKAMLLREEMPIPPRDDNDVEDGEDLGEETEEELKERLIKVDNLGMEKLGTVDTCDSEHSFLSSLYIPPPQFCSWLHEQLLSMYYKH